MIRILHVAADFPDALSDRKTQAIRNLVEGARELGHSVFSINRRSGLGGVKIVDRTDDVVTLMYRAPAYGLFLESFLAPVAAAIVVESRRHGERIDVVHAHKLTIEGLVARRVARSLGCPYVCSVRGNTDQKYLRLKPEKRSAWRDVAENAARLLPVTPWIDRYVVDKLSLRNVPRTVLPTISDIEGFVPPTREGTRFVTAFNLDSWRLKGMPHLLDALQRLHADQVLVSLDIIGGGSDGARASLLHAIQSRGLEDHVSLLGPVSHEALQQTLNGYAGFVLPTLRETFGMVYLEALFSGVPILYSQGRGVDGFFDGHDVGVRCDPRSVDSIVAGWEELRTRSTEMKVAIAQLQENGGFDRFRRREVCRTYVSVMRAVATERERVNSGAELR